MWSNIPETVEVAEWLSEPPNELEMNACIRKMKNNRQPGEVGFVVEALKYGGSKLKDRVFEIR